MGLKTEFAKKLREYRKKRGLTQEELAELVSVDSRHISFIETARSFPSSDLIERFARVLNVNYSMLFNFQQEVAREEIISNLNNIIAKLDDKKLEYLYKMAIEL